MILNSLAAIKRQLTKGTTVVMTRHDLYVNCPLVGVKRKIVAVQGNGVQFERIAEGKARSWLRLDRPANFYVGLSNNTFKVILGEETGASMEYEILEKL